MSASKYICTIVVFVTGFWSSTAATINQTGNPIRIGFWNIRDFSVASRDSDELKQIASVAHSIDCLAIAEVNDGRVLSKLASKLRSQGGKWKRVQTSDKVGNTKNTAERYGFVYRSDKLKVRGTPKVLAQRFYTVAGETALREFDREPFVCSFSTLDGRFDFTVMVVHITWGSKVAYRKGEIRELGPYFNSVQDSNQADNDVILCGDFNRDVGDPDSLGFLLSSISSLVDTTSPAPPTTIDTDHTYDHLLFQTSFVQEYSGQHGVITFDETLFDNDDEIADRVCSDHRSVWVQMTVPAQDDD